MIRKVVDTIINDKMIENGDKIIVGVSGGPDSICLLHLLYSLKEKFNIQLIAAHINHCLRGKEADADENYVKEFCAMLNIDFYSKRIDINELAQKMNISHESAGRMARYEFFQNLKNDLNAEKIALAHNANDKAETVIMRLVRGTGLEGLVGIKSVRDNIFIRPLINITRDEIEKYCLDNNLNPRIDKTNLETIYTRNKVRLELIPYIKENFNPDIITTLNRLSDIVSKDNECLEQMSEDYFKKYCYVKDSRIIILKEAFLAHEAIITRVIRKSFGCIKGNMYNLEKVHIDDILSLQKGETGKKINLPELLVAINNYGDITIGREIDKETEKKIETTSLSFGDNVVSDFKITIRKINNKSEVNLKQDESIKIFDLDKVKGDIIIRTRRDGDRFVPLGMKGSKKLKDLFIDLKIPKEERDSIPLICFGNDIGYIVGYRISEKFKVDKNTKNILEIKIERGV